MTVYNWSEMSPRERDALVAEKVMGWTWESLNDYYGFWTDVDEDGFSSKRLDDKWKPSTDISSAWEVVGRFTRDEVIIQQFSYGWYVIINTGNDSFKSGEQATAPEAICLAALRAVGIDIQ